MNKSLEYVKNQIVKFKDDLQHYTMVEKDSVLASQIRYDLDMFGSIEKELKALEIIRRNKMVEFDLEWELDNNLITQEEYDLLKEALK